MKNTVIANRKKEDWPIIKNYFESRGVEIMDGFGGGCYPETGDVFYYGVIDGTFMNYSLASVKKANAIILEVSDIVDTIALPKSFVLHLHKAQGSIWKKRIEEVVPELFEDNTPSDIKDIIEKYEKKEINKYLK